MTNKRTFKMMLLFVAILFTFSSCKKNEVVLRTGTLQVTFVRDASSLPNLNYYVSPSDNATYAISGLDINFEKRILTIKKLNPGNYYLVYDTPYETQRVLFQIHSGETTELTREL
ncbi:hypothetical protein PbJCM13498_38990 [Prolixibacter bellariivorans]|uniref:DUF4397 domain-containing protein n=1 Tax=Prolixibacter bellariivorans TaxID=314319 RepID=A0A5M4B579_9BACT|nr:hypothetical protein [Prolixibacter bellariivorans]GET35036.1 hypothetical protein PbJCM13498_38990 [Prolixibacter bellariivorans]